MNILRRLPLPRLLLLCSVVLAVGIGATALAMAVSSSPVAPQKPFGEAVHDALAGPKVSGVSARIQFTNHLLEGSNLASGGGGEASQLASSPLISGASGRLWIGADGHARLELQSEKGDTQILYDGENVSMYDASTNTLYRYTPPKGTSATTTAPDSKEAAHKTPTAAEIEEELARARKHADVSGATPTDVGAQPAYTVRVSPKENGGLIGGAELSWDAVHGTPLRAAVYSTASSSPVIELAASEVSYGPVDSSTLEFKPPADAKVENVTLPKPSAQPAGGSSTDPGKPKVTVHGKGLGAIVLAESPVKSGSKESGMSQLEGLQQVDINGVKASELPTQLGTLISFERAGVRYLLVGSVTPNTIEAFARGL
ncbi:MAG TPA: hypothetical protein VGI26_10915 [Solirubrobacteraceae bacterium]|jgi:outer membrane lipoprotein-sorting protein